MTAYCISRTGLKWTGLVKRGLVKRGLVYCVLVKHGLVKRGASKSRTSKTQQNTVEALVSDRLGNSEKWSQLKRPRGKTVEGGRLGKL